MTRPFSCPGPTHVDGRPVEQIPPTPPKGLPEWLTKPAGDKR